MNILYRAGYVRHIPWNILMAWILWRWLGSGPRRYLLSAAPVVLAVLIYAYIWTFHNQARLSDMITEDSLHALQWLDDQYPGEGIVTNAYSMSVWVEALNGVASPPVWNPAPPPAYANEYERVRCVLGWMSSCDVRAAADYLDVSWVLVDLRFPFVRPVNKPDYGSPGYDQWQVTASAPHLELVYDRGDTRLWRIAP